MAGPGWLGGVHPLLFAAYPVLFLWSQNLGEVPPEDVAQPLVFVVDDFEHAAVAKILHQRGATTPPRGTVRPPAAPW